MCFVLWLTLGCSWLSVLGGLHGICMGILGVGMFVWVCSRLVNTNLFVFLVVVFVVG